MHTPQALRFDDPQPGTEPQGLSLGRKPHMPSVLQFDDAPQPTKAAAQPRALDLGSPAAPATPSAPASCSPRPVLEPVLGPQTGVGNNVAQGLLQTVQALATQRGLRPDQADSAARQAGLLQTLEVSVLDTWGAQALEQHTRNVSQVSVLRDRINEACLGDVLARISSVPDAAAQAAKPALAGVLAGLLHTGKTSTPQAHNWDDMAQRACQAASLARGFAKELQELAPECLSTRDRLAVMLTSLEAVGQWATTAGLRSEAAPEITRLGVRQELLARAFVQAGLLGKTLEALAENTTAWIDQAEYLQNVLIPARRLAQA